MKNVSNHEKGLSFWSEIIKKIDYAISVSAITNPVIRTMQLKKYNLTEDAFKKMRVAALTEIYCFAAYSSFVAGSRLFVKLLGFNRASWVEFIEGVEQGMRAQVSALPKQEEDFFMSAEDSAYRLVIQYMQTFTKGDAKANVAWILAMDKSTLKETFNEYEDNLKEAVSIVTPDGEYPSDLMQWCPDAATIYNYAAELAAK